MSILKEDVPLEKLDPGMNTLEMKLDEKQKTYKRKTIGKMTVMKKGKVLKIVMEVAKHSGSTQKQVKIVVGNQSLFIRGTC